MASGFLAQEARPKAAAESAEIFFVESYGERKKKREVRVEVEEKKKKKKFFAAVFFIRTARVFRLPIDLFRGRFFRSEGE